MPLGQAVVNAILTELGRDADLARLSHLEDQQLADILEKYAGDSLVSYCRDAPGPPEELRVCLAPGAGAVQ